MRKERLQETERGGQRREWGDEKRDGWKERAENDGALKLEGITAAGEMRT